MAESNTEKKYKHEILQGLPIKFGGLLVYPVRVKDIKPFDNAKDCIAIMQQKLPVELATIPYLRMLYAMDGAGIPWWGNLAKLLSLVLKVPDDCIHFKVGEEGKIALHIVRTVTWREWINKLRAWLGMKKVSQVETIQTISESQFSILRKIIAAQNKVDLPREEANLEILESEADIKSAETFEIEPSTEKLMFSMANILHMKMSDLEEMTIYEFRERAEAVSRLEYFKIFGAAEMSGMVKFKNGNPYPSWCYDKRTINMHGLIPLSNLQKSWGGVIEDRTPK